MSSIRLQVPASPKVRRSKMEPFLKQIGDDVQFIKNEIAELKALVLTLTGKNDNNDLENPYLDMRIFSTSDSSSISSSSCHDTVLSDIFKEGDELANPARDSNFLKVDQYPHDLRTPSPGHYSDLQKFFSEDENLCEILTEIDSPRAFSHVAEEHNDNYCSTPIPDEDLDKSFVGDRSLPDGCESMEEAKDLQGNKTHRKPRSPTHDQQESHYDIPRSPVPHATSVFNAVPLERPLSNAVPHGTPPSYEVPLATPSSNAALLGTPVSTKVPLGASLSDAVPSE